MLAFCLEFLIADDAAVLKIERVGLRKLAIA